MENMKPLSEFKCRWQLINPTGQAIDLSVSLLIARLKWLGP